MLEYATLTCDRMHLVPTCPSEGSMRISTLSSRQQAEAPVHSCSTLLQASPAWESVRLVHASFVISIGDVSIV